MRFNASPRQLDFLFPRKGQRIFLGTTLQLLLKSASSWTHDSSYYCCHHHIHIRSNDTDIFWPCLTPYLPRGDPNNQIKDNCVTLQLVSLFGEVGAQHSCLRIGIWVVRIRSWWRPCSSIPWKRELLWNA